jgi:hypothetical protein
VAIKLAFHGVIVIVGVLILAGAVNTSLIGVNGVMTRVAEDGVLLDWFRKPHAKFGTTYRILNLMALLQIVTILASRGDVLLLGEAYAFGVVWVRTKGVRVWVLAASAPRSGIQVSVQHHQSGIELLSARLSPPPSFSHRDRESLLKRSRPCTESPSPSSLYVLFHLERVNMGKAA